MGTAFTIGILTRILILVTNSVRKFFPIGKSAGKSTILHGLPCILFDDDILGYRYTDGNSQRQGEGKKGVDLLSYETVYSVIK